MTSKPIALLEEIRRAVAVIFFMLRSVVELRVPKAGKAGTISGYYNDPERLAQDAYANCGRGPGTYFTLNPVNPALMARASNRAQPYARETTADKDILRRCWMLVDFDPKRPSGISSTDAEHNAALERAREVREYLRGVGWPDPVYADSGNGGHLLYRVDLPNDDAAKDLIKGCTNAIADKFSDEIVDVDRTTYNAARILKIYGTVAGKGEHTDDRPHRLSSMLDVPKSPVPVSLELLRTLAGETPEERPKKKANTASSNPSPTFDLNAWIAERGIEIARGPESYDGGLRWILCECPWNPEHRDAAVFQTAEGRLGFKCFHASCSEYHWAEFRKHYEPDYDPERNAGGGNQTYTYSDLGNARRFVVEHRHRVRYCHAWKRWLTWNGKRWRTDENGQMERLARQTLRNMADEARRTGNADFLKHITKSESEPRIKAMLILAQSEPGVPVSPDDLDTDPFLLNIKNGTIDLRTGELRAHQQSDLITKIAPVSYEPDAPARVFMRFIIKIMGGDRPLIRFVQRALGYSLTGDTREQVYFLCLGGGANGKSTLLNIMLRLLGEGYASDTPAETLMAKKYGDGVPNDLARMKGARFVTVSEAEGGVFNDAKLKRMTGQDRITARYMRAEYFEYFPQFKLFIACNERPRFAGTGYATWRRTRVITFGVTIPHGEQDKRLPEKLWREAPGILAWCVRGCLAWQKQGLGIPQRVADATESCRAENDVVAAFIDECCDLSEGLKVAATQLYTAYKLWGAAGREPIMSQRQFGENLKERGLQKTRGGEGGQFTYSGIALRVGLLNELNELNSSLSIRHTKKINEDIGNTIQLPLKGSVDDPAEPRQSPETPVRSATPQDMEWLV